MVLSRAPRGHAAPCHPEPPTAPPAGTSRRALLSGGPLALVAAVALAGCATRPLPRPAAPPARPADARRGELEDGLPETVAGERLNPGPLRRFYARHGFAPVWATRPDEADSLTAAVLNAGAHGLDPGLFHAAALRRGSELSPLDRDLLLSDAILSYADALAHGVVPVARREPFETLAPEQVDVVAALETAIGSPDPASVIEALAPTTPTYRELRRALGRLAPGAAAGERADGDRRRTIEVNLERQRWLPRALPADRVWVNVADQKLVLYRADRPVFSARVVVGRDGERDQSPEFRTEIGGIFFNPPWVVPKDIVQTDLLPRILRDPDYLARNNMVMREDGEVEQRPGPEAGLGFLMLDMPNGFDVYLHDTPGRHVFARENRRLSHGCIRVENPRELAALLMRQPVERVDEEIATGVTTRRALPSPIPVFLVYQTAFVDADGTPQFRPDFYDRDDRIRERMTGSPRPVARARQTDRPARPAAPRNAVRATRRPKR